MSTFFFILVVLAALMTLAVLFTGLFAMARGGEFNKKYGNKLMRMRVITQFVAILLFAIAMMLRDSGS